MKKIKFYLFFFVSSVTTFIALGQMKAVDTAVAQISVGPTETKWKVPFIYSIPVNSISINVGAENIDNDDAPPMIGFFKGYLPILGSNFELKVWSNSITEIITTDEKNLQLSKIVKWLSSKPNYKKVTETYRSIQSKENSSLSTLFLKLTYEKVVGSRVFYVESEFRGIVNSAGAAFVQFEVIYVSQFNRKSNESEFSRYSNLLLNGLQVTQVKNKILDEFRIGTVNQEGLSDEGIVPPPEPDDILTNSKSISYGNPLKNTVQEPLLFCTPPIYLPLIFFELPVFAGGSRSDYDANLAKLKEKNRQIEIVNNDRFLKYKESLDEYMQCLNEWIIEHRKWRSATPNWRHYSIYTALLELK